MTFEIWSGATKPILEITVYEQLTKKKPLNLSTLDTAKVIWIDDSGVVNERTMTVESVEGGVLQYEWLTTDTDTYGYFDMHFLLEFNDDTKLVVTEQEGKKDKLLIRNSGVFVCS